MGGQGGNDEVTWLRRLVDVREGETRAMLSSFVYFFFVMSGYFILRPIRDEVAAASGVSKLPWLFTGTLAVTLCFNPLFYALVVRFRARRVISTSYHFFAANLVAFYLLLRLSPRVRHGPRDLDGASVLCLDERVQPVRGVDLLVVHGRRIPQRPGEAVVRLHRRRRHARLDRSARRHRGARDAHRNGQPVLVSATLIELAVITVTTFPHFGAQATGRDDRPIGGTVRAGVTDILKSPYLLVICAFQILYVLGSTVLYFAQSDIVGHTYVTRDARTEVLAQLELAAQGLTVLIQVFFTGRVIRWIGLTATLALLPALSMLGFSALGAIPMFATLAVFTVIRRASNFSLTNPSVEVLYTVVPREEKYKAKNFIETFVYRGGDQIAAWAYAGLAALGLGMAGISFVTVPFSALWLIAAIWLGRRFASRAANDGVASPPSMTPRPASIPTPA